MEEDTKEVWKMTTQQRQELYERIEYSRFLSSNQEEDPEDVKKNVQNNQF